MANVDPSVSHETSGINCEDVPRTGSLDANTEEKPVFCSFLIPKQILRYDAGKVQTVGISEDSYPEVLRSTFSRLLRHIT